MNTRLARTVVIAALIAPVAGYAADTKKVDTDDKGVVTLSGNDKSKAEADKAVKIAGDTKGVTSVKNDKVIGTVKESVKESVSDAVITTSIKAENANDKDVGALKMKVDAGDKGVVTLSGNAGSKAEADKAVNTNASPAANRGAEALPPVDPGAGNRANAVNSITLPAQAGKKFDWDSANFAALPSGFNLISTVQSLTPSQFNLQVSPTPPSLGVIPTDNFISLWAWDATDKVWYFYSPMLEASGGLAAVKAYADSHSFRHFQDYDKQLDLGAGFWVNRR